MNNLSVQQRRVVDLVAASGSEGMSKAELCLALNVYIGTLEAYLAGLVPGHLAVNDPRPGGKRQTRRYYQPGCEPSPQPKAKARTKAKAKKPAPVLARVRTTTIRDLQKSIARDEPVIVPPHVKPVTKQNYIGDTRYVVTDAPRVIDARDCRPWAVAAARPR